MSSTVFLAINFKSGRGDIQSELALILSEISLKAKKLIVHIIQPSGPSIEKALTTCAKEVDLVISCGGDGTLMNVVTAMNACGMNTCPLGHIPTGTTNDFAKSLRFNLNPQAAVKQILKRNCAQIDLGKFNDKFFTYVASFGAFTRASYDTPQSLKNMFGHLAYILSGVTELTRIRDYQLRISTDEYEFEDKYIFGAVSNSTSLGGIVNLAKELVDLQDGLFEVILVKRPQNIVELKQIIDAITVQNYDTELIQIFQTQKIIFESDEQFTWSLDGERSDNVTKVVIENFHNHLTLCVAKDTKNVLLKNDC